MRKTKRIIIKRLRRTEVSDASVYFIGAGPGDPELITVKGRKAIERADVIIYAGSLVSRELLKYARHDAEIYDSSTMTLGEIDNTMKTAAGNGRTVARIHTGDPSLYGALSEQCRPLDAAGISYKVIPGVSSAFASAAAIRKELTMPEVCQTVIFTRIEGRTPVPVKERLSGLATHRATMCIFLSVGMIDRVVSELLSGYPEDTGAVVVERATWPDERIISGTLRNISEKVKQAGIKKQAMIIVGEVLNSGGTQTLSRLYDRGFEHGYRKKT